MVLKQALKRKLRKLNTHNAKATRWASSNLWIWGTSIGAAAPPGRHWCLARCCEREGTERAWSPIAFYEGHITSCAMAHAVKDVSKEFTKYQGTQTWYELVPRYRRSILDWFSDKDYHA